MYPIHNPSGGNTDSKGTRLLSAADLSRILKCSQRSVFRFLDAGKIPRPIKIGSLIRWVAQDIDDWLAEGCPSLQSECK